MSSFGLYKGSNGAGYDRIIILELFNAPKQFKRDLKVERTTITNPRLNICVLGHPDAYIKCIQDERANKDDGLIQTFHLCVPQPAFFTPEEIMSADTNYCAIQKVFYAVYIIHKDHFQYKLSEEAALYFNLCIQNIKV